MAETADIAAVNNTFPQLGHIRYRARSFKQQANILIMSLPPEESAGCCQLHFPESGKLVNERVPLYDVVECVI